MWSIIDKFLNKITMYRLVLCFLAGLVAVAIILGWLGILPYSPVSIILSSGLLLLVSFWSNEIFAKTYGAPTNTESVYITALILSLIVSPVTSLTGFVFLAWVALLSTASKYILNINRKHIFNPAAIAVVLTAAGFNGTASWWVGNAPMAMLVGIGGLLIVRKIRRERMLASFLITVGLISLGFWISGGQNIINGINTLIFHSSLLFFAGVMLTEPLTSPTTSGWQQVFGVLVGILFLPQVHFGGIYLTPELALVIGNMMAFVVSPKYKFLLKLKEKIKTAPDSYDFIYIPEKRMDFAPGQYMEWTLSHNNPDDRGNRRYFTIASSPTENELRIGLKFYPESSSYKKAILESENQPMVAGQLAGDFTLPKSITEKSVLIAGGIGITPFRSMAKYLIDNQQKRDMILLYSNRNKSEIIYKEIFDEAEDKVGLRTYYTITDMEKESQSDDWTGLRGRFDGDRIKLLIPDYRERKYYISGPHVMVAAMEQELKDLGIKKEKIKTDFFPGFA